PLPQGPATMSCDAATGALDWLPGTNNLGTKAVVLRATDAGGAATDQSFNIVVTTPTGPEVDLEPTGIVMTNVTVDSVTLALSGTIKVLVQNNGNDPVPIPFTVSVFVDADFDGLYSTNADRVVARGIIPAGLAKGSVGILEMALHGEALFKDAPLSAFVDSEGVVPEYDENNNLKRSGFDVNTNVPPVLDLSASSLQVNRSSLPTNAILTARLGNSGFVNVPANVPVSFYDGVPQAGGTLIATAHSSAILHPGQFEDVSVTWPTPTIANHTVFVVADDLGNGTGLYAEITEANNRFSAEADLTANEPPIADAGPDVTVYVGDYAVLNGRDSHDPESKPLTYRWAMLSIPIGSQVQVTNATGVQPWFQPDLAGKYTIKLVVNDGVQDSTNLETLVVTAVDTNANHYPVITSRPSFQGMSNVLYTYAVQATDEDGDLLKYSLAQFPVGMAINTNTGLIQWTPTTPGSYFVQVNVFDARGAGVFQNWSVTIVPFQNLPPQFTSAPVQTASPGTNYSYDADATDPNNDSITYALTQKPAGMSINAASGLISWNPTAGQLGGNPVSVTATDSRGAASTQAFNVVVFTPGQDGPVVQPIPDQIVVNPAAFATIPLDLYVLDPNDPKSSLTWTVTGTNKLTMTIDTNRAATISYAGGILTSERITFLATDPSGRSGFASAQFTVRAADNPPVAALANLSDTDTTVINTGTFELKGTATDPDAIDAVAYRIVLYDPATGNQIANLTPPPVNAAGQHEGRVAAGGSLGTLDFTMVRNGAYTLMLEVHGGNLTTTTTASLALDSALKLGQVTFAQQDVVFPIGGVGLQIIRSYDSLNPEAGDFGYSWTYAVTDIGLSINEQRVQEQDLFGEFFSLRTGGGRDVTLTMPDSGQRVTFRYSLNPGGLFRLRAAWTPPPGVGATLAPIGSATAIKLFSLPIYWEAAGLEVGFENFDFPGFILTLQDGTQYRVDRKDLGDHFIAGTGEGLGNYVHAYGDAHLTRIIQPTGDRTEFVQENGVLKNIEQYNQVNERVKSILFQRNAEKRINAVYAPENLDSNGVPVGPASMAYDYDAAGNLIHARKLQNQGDPANPVYTTTTYLYEHSRFPHFITEVKDSKGVSLMRFEYDLQGRLVATYDAYGNKRTLDFNLSSRTTTVFDALGNPTVFTYDDRGNVLANTDALGGTTRFTYNQLNQITSITDPLGHRRTFTFDANGALTAVTDPLGNATSYAMSSNQFRITDALGRVSVQTFNAAGKIASASDAAGNTTSIEYDANGNPSSVVNALGQKVAEATFDSKGRFVSSSNYLGLVESAGYDASGNVTRNAAVWRGFSGTNSPTEAVVLHSYDAAGNKLSDTLPDGRTRSYEYDAAGRRVAFTDPSGQRSTILYNASGRILGTDFADGSVVRNVFDANNRLILITDRAPVGSQPDGTRVIYDALSRPVRVERIADVVVNVVTQQNLLSTVFAGSGPVISFVETNYDAASRPIGVLSSDGRGMS
nr:putative Ig domain-containing protein [Verrucomicrobiota bacterium]